MNVTHFLKQLFILINRSNLQIATLTTDGDQQICVELLTGEKYILTIECTDQQL